MGGKITAESEKGKGSTFSFTMNMIAGTEHNNCDKLAITPPVTKQKVLVIDGHVDAAEVLSKILSGCDIKNTIVNNVEAAIPLLEKNDYTIIFIDFELGSYTGDQVAEMLNNKFPNKNLNLVFLSHVKASIRVDKLRKTEKYDFITKPVLQTKIKSIFLKKFGQPEESSKKATAKTTSKEPENNKKLSILVAEDQIINRKIVVQLLEKKGWKVTTVENGQLAIDQYTAHPKQYNIILMDVQMPEVDGYTATEKIREFEQKNGNHIPIVAMTAFAMVGDKEKCIAVGMDHYISKPISPDELYSTIIKYAHTS